MVLEIIISLIRRLSITGREEIQLIQIHLRDTKLKTWKTASSTIGRLWQAKTTMIDQKLKENTLIGQLSIRYRALNGRHITEDLFIF